MMKITKKQYRANVIANLVTVFDRSGNDFGCFADVMNTVRDDAELLAKKAYSDGFNFSRAEFISPVIMMRDMFAHECAKAIYARDYGNRR